MLYLEVCSCPRVAVLDHYSIASLGSVGLPKQRTNAFCIYWIILLQKYLLQPFSSFTVTSFFKFLEKCSVLKTIINKIPVCESKEGLRWFEELKMSRILFLEQLRISVLGWSLVKERKWKSSINNGIHGKKGLDCFSRMLIIKLNALSNTFNYAESFFLKKKSNWENRMIANRRMSLPL